jgi:group I intron endonuclease
MSNSIKSKKLHFIYKTTNLLNGRFYIGMHSTNNIKDGYIGSGTRLRHAIRKYGLENFQIEILEFCETREKLIEREKQIITEKHIHDVNCYNLKFGGLGGGKFYSKEHQFKCSQAAGLKHSERLKTDEEYRKKRSVQISEANKKRHQRGDIKPIQENYSWIGKNHRPETIQKMKESKKGQGSGIHNSQYGTKWITNGTENKKIKSTESLPIGWWYGVKKVIWE